MTLVRMKAHLRLKLERYSDTLAKINNFLAELKDITDFEMLEEELDFQFGPLLAKLKDTTGIEMQEATLDFPFSPTLPNHYILVVCQKNIRLGRAIDFFLQFDTLKIQHILQQQNIDSFNQQLKEYENELARIEQIVSHSELEQRSLAQAHVAAPNECLELAEIFSNQEHQLLGLRAASMQQQVEIKKIDQHLANVKSELDSHKQEVASLKSESISLQNWFEAHLPRIPKGSLLTENYNRIISRQRQVIRAKKAKKESQGKTLCKLRQQTWKICSELSALYLRYHITRQYPNDFLTIHRPMPGHTENSKQQIAQAIKAEQEKLRWQHRILAERHQTSCKRDTELFEQKMLTIAETVSSGQSREIITILDESLQTARKIQNEAHHELAFQPQAATITPKFNATCLSNPQSHDRSERLEAHAPPRPRFHSI